MWQEQPDGEWRFSLQNTHTKECTAFATLGELFTYLIQEIDPGGGKLSMPDRNQATQQ
jgi:hypothetical protein